MTQPLTTQPPPLPRRAYRDPDDRVLGGVAAGLAEHLRVPPVHLRIGFVLLAMLGGFGALVYAGLWLLLPVRLEVQPADVPPGLSAASRQGRRTGSDSRRRRDISVALSLVLCGIGVVVILQNAGLGLNPRVFWPLLVAVCGLVLLWWQADESTRNSVLSTSGGWWSWARVAVGLALLVSAGFVALVQVGATREIGTAVVVLGLAAVGVCLVIGPWLLRLNNQLRTERAERIRSQERADVAAHLHDSVLQTLAMIQRQAHDPAAVAQLARTQERELRSWLFEVPDGASSTLRSALQQAAAEVEDTHRVPVELVVVGDVAAGESVAALVAAAREAMVNAARHSRAPKVDVYAEVSDGLVEIFVRDRGIGFDLAAVSPDRKGVRHSIIERTRRYGGEAEVRSSATDGTEVRLWLSLRPDGRQA